MSGAGRGVLLVGNLHGVAYRGDLLLETLRAGGCPVSYEEWAAEFPSFRQPLRWLVRTWQWLRFTARVVAGAPKHDAIYLLPISHRAFPAAYLAKVLSRKPLISELYVSFFDTARDRGRLSQRSMLWRAAQERFCRVLDRWILTQSDLVIHLSRFELEHIASLVGAALDDTRVLIAPLSVDRRATARLAPDATRVFRLCWWGNFIPLHGVDAILEAMRLLRDRGAPVELDLFGVPGPRAEHYAARIRELGVAPCVRVHTDKTFKDNGLEEHLVGRCDLALGIFGDSDKAVNTVANKVVDAFSMGLPVLTRESPALAEFIRSDEELFTCRHTPADIAEAILEIMDRPEERRRRAELGLRRFENTFAPEIYQENLRRGFRRVGVSC